MGVPKTTVTSKYVASTERTTICPPCYFPSVGRECHKTRAVVIPCMIFRTVIRHKDGSTSITLWDLLKSMLYFLKSLYIKLHYTERKCHLLNFLIHCTHSLHLGARCWKHEWATAAWYPAILTGFMRWSLKKWLLDRIGEQDHLIRLFGLKW